ncbi:ATP-binding cassette domain-containing protein [Kocuria sp. p3-SID1433]|uniref:ATP-binding cassette domain-containing protein n=1 Tax=unclassified Kocuria TaxID=2649579 RepID=UPI0021A6CAB0|nr:MULTISPECIES: ATP-binding cassette domain-containing protein [unclassified Kocuria]MCT1601252.1 ATP-binding cassette domain-containing protein [Kocuria sp. p3-SID1428]MCT2180303.1 ATP-binding cassette domain-containing protein [Kocuria sp. p3-SID1433]
MTERFRIEGLIKTHGHRRVLRGIDLTVGEGEIVGLVGSNGAGKSTLISIASGAARANGGTMHLSVRPYPPASGRRSSWGSAPCSSASRRLRA